MLAAQSYIDCEASDKLRVDFILGGLMSECTIAILAAGIGSRYGGLKQADPVGPHGQLIIHYSVYDAMRAGFSKVVFVIRREIEEVFRERVGRAVERQIDVAYVFQEPQDLPDGFTVPAGRKKPWGTGHAVLCCKDVTPGNFAAINADDFYGADSFRTLAGFLSEAHDTVESYNYAMVGYVLSNTLSEHGDVARGVCQVGPTGHLESVRERRHIAQTPDGPGFKDESGILHSLPPDSLVSMNMWGFTPSFRRAGEPLPGVPGARNRRQTCRARACGFTSVGVPPA